MPYRVPGRRRQRPATGRGSSPARAPRRSPSPATRRPRGGPAGTRPRTASASQTHRIRIKHSLCKGRQRGGTGEGVSGWERAWPAWSGCSGSMPNSRSQRATSSWPCVVGREHTLLLTDYATCHTLLADHGTCHSDDTCQQATQIGVRPSRSAHCASAPRPVSHRATPSCPFAQATQSGVQPSASAAHTSAARHAAMSLGWLRVFCWRDGILKWQH